MSYIDNEQTNDNQETILDQTIQDPESGTKRKITQTFISGMNALKPGDHFLDEFEIVKFLGKGGAGAVYLAKRQSLGDVFAAKFPIRDVMADERTRKLFFREIRTWIGLPTHPHLTACRFIRSLEQKIIIFSEYVDGGSLTQWIADKRLLKLEEILDVAIQMAWGLQAAHDSNVVHQDVKPSNVLIARDGTTKITDFGLSRAYQTLEEMDREMAPAVQDQTKMGSQTASVSSGIMTPMYCSPEQSDRRQVDYRTDIWSWGVTVLSMFTGPARWISGVVALNILEGLIKRGPSKPWPAIPESVAQVLRKCFQMKPDDRWQSMQEVADQLMEIYLDHTGKPYGRSAPETLPNTEFTGQLRSLKNMEKAFDILGRDLRELEILTESAGATHQAHILNRIELYHEVGLRLRDTDLLKNSSNRHLFIELMLEKSELHRLIADLDGTATITEQLIKLLDLVPQSERSSTDRHLSGNILFERAIIYMRRMQYAEARELLSKAFDTYELAVKETDEARTWLVMVNVQNAQAIICHGIREVQRALEFQDYCVSILKMLKARGQKGNIDYKLAGALANKAVFLGDLGRSEESVNLHLESTALMEQVVVQQDRKELIPSLAMNHMNLACELFTLRRFTEALDSNNKAIKLMEQQLHEKGNLEVRLFLARIYMNKGNTLAGLKRNEESLIEIVRGKTLIEQMLFNEGNTELVEELIYFHRNHAMTLMNLKRFPEAIDLLTKSEETIRNCYADRDKNSYRWLLTLIGNYKAKVTKNAGDTEENRHILTRVMEMARESDVELTAQYLRHFKLTVWNYFKALGQVKTPEELVEDVAMWVEYLAGLPCNASDDDLQELMEIANYYTNHVEIARGDTLATREKLHRFREFIAELEKQKPEDDLDIILADVDRDIQTVTED